MVRLKNAEDTSCWKTLAALCFLVATLLMAAVLMARWGLLH